MPNEETVERPHGAEPELDGRPAKFVAPQEPQVSAEIIPLQCLPCRGLLPLRLVPAMKLQHRLPIVPLRVGRSAPIRGQVLQELIDPLVVDRWLRLCRLHYAALFVVSDRKSTRLNSSH